MAYTRTDGSETHRGNPHEPPGRARWKAPRPLVVLGCFLGAIAVASTVLAAAGVTYTGAGGKTQSLHGLLSASGLANLLVTAVTNFTSFPALGVVLTLTLGLGIAQGTGALEAAVRLAFLRVPARVVPYGVAFLACQGHVMSDAAFIVIPRLAMEVYRVKGRNPLAGLIAGLACTTVGYGGGLLFGTADVGYTGVTEAAARLLPHTATGVIGTTMNWFFSAAAGIVVPIVCGWIIVHVLEPRLPAAQATTGDTQVAPELTGRQRRAVYVGYTAVVVFVAVMVTWWLWPASPLRGEGGALVQSPFMKSMAPMLALAFAVFGYAYARAAGVPRESRDLMKLMSGALRDLTGFIVVTFVLAQITAALSWTGLTTYLASGTASGLERMHLNGYAALLAVAVLTLVMSLLIGGTALWGLEAPVLVPALMLTGISPAAAQIAFRMAVGPLSMLSPANAFLLYAHDTARQLDPQISLGYLIRKLSYFVLPAVITWFVLLAVFYFAHLPIGPGASIHLP